MLKTPFVTLLLCASLLAQSTTPTASTKLPIEEIKQTVAFVYGDSHLKDPKTGKIIHIKGALGTAFFVGYRDKSGEGFAYAVTAKHVLRDELTNRYLDSVALRVNLKDRNDVALLTIPVSDSNGNLLWFTDKDDPDADIAITSRHPLENEIAWKHIDSPSFCDAEFLKRHNITEGESVYLFGLLPQFTGTHRNYPVVRRGSIAMISDEPLPIKANDKVIKEKLYVLDLQAWQGQSGSPVFLSLGGIGPNGSFTPGAAFYLLGVMLAYQVNIRPFDIIDQQPADSLTIGTAENIGISYVLPADEIVKILNSKEAQDARDKEVALEGKHFKPMPK